MVLWCIRPGAICSCCCCSVHSAPPCYAPPPRRYDRALAGNNVDHHYYWDEKRTMVVMTMEEQKNRSDAVEPSLRPCHRRRESQFPWTLGLPREVAPPRTDWCRAWLLCLSFTVLLKANALLVLYSFLFSFILWERRSVPLTSGVGSIS